MGLVETCQVILLTSGLLLCGLDSVISLNPDRSSSPVVHSLEHNSEDEGGDNGRRCEMECLRNSTARTESREGESLLCGTDGFTYLGYEEMGCVRKCGKDVRLRGYGRCPAVKAETGNHQLSSGTNLLQFLSPSSRTTPSQIPKEDEFNLKVEGEPLRFPVQPSTVMTSPVSSEPVVNQSGGVVGGKHLGGRNQNRNGKEICLPDECNCPLEFRPLCGSDSVTYGNECLMECNKNCKPDIVKFHEGHCGKPFEKSGCISSTANECGCPDGEDSLRPVCGTDNITYWNRCLLECNKNCNQDLELSHDGYCGRLFFPTGSVLQNSVP